MGHVDASPELGPFRSRTPLPLRNRDGESVVWLTVHLSQLFCPWSNHLQQEQLVFGRCLMVLARVGVDIVTYWL